MFFRGFYSESQGCFRLLEQSRRDNKIYYLITPII